MFYFAYGSNLSTVRMRKRVPSSRLITTGLLRRHRLVFHKIGQDGSAKCDAWYSGTREDYTLGVVYRIDPSQKPLLDAAEGLGNGYMIRVVDIMMHSGRELSAFLYAATCIDPDRKPFDWYKEHVLSGMREHNFPGHYLAAVEEIAAIADPDYARSARELLIYNQEVNIFNATGAHS